MSQWDDDDVLSSAAVIVWSIGVAALWVVVAGVVWLVRWLV